MKPRALTARSLRRATTGAVAPHAIPTRGGVGGQVPPTSVHTQGNLLGNGLNSSLSAAPTGAARAAGPRGKKWSPRHRLGRGARQGWRVWVGNVARALEARGARDLAHNLRACGSMARVRACGACGDAVGSVEVRASCGLRCCPWCARISAREKVSLVSRAVDRVEHYQRLRAPEVVARLGEDWRAAHEALLYWIRRGSLRAEDYGLKPGEADGPEEPEEPEEPEVPEGGSAWQLRCADRAYAAAQRMALAKRQVKGVRDLLSWRWKLVTISPPWDPLDAGEYTPAGLRARVRAALESFKRAWDAGARAGGLAAATLRVEVSTFGHVHLHVLFRGPWIDQRWWARQCGCIVDVRALKGPRGVVEAVKYTLKMPTPTRGEWLSGDARRVPHPELAANWLVATRRAQLLRHVGVMREAIIAEEACGEERDEERDEGARCRCASCGSDLSSAEVALVKTDFLARYLGHRWGIGGGPGQAGLLHKFRKHGGPIGPKGSIAAGVVGKLPARLSIVRAPW